MVIIRKRTKLTTAVHITCGEKVVVTPCPGYGKKRVMRVAVVLPFKTGKLKCPEVCSCKVFFVCLKVVWKRVCVVVFASRHGLTEKLFRQSCGFVVRKVLPSIKWLCRGLCPVEAVMWQRVGWGHRAWPGRGWVLVPTVVMMVEMKSLIIWWERLRSISPFLQLRYCYFYLIDLATLNLFWIMQFLQQFYICWIRVWIPSFTGCRKWLDKHNIKQCW